MRYSILNEIIFKRVFLTAICEICLIKQNFMLYLFDGNEDLAHRVLSLNLGMGGLQRGPSLQESVKKTDFNNTHVFNH